MLYSFCSQGGLDCTDGAYPYAGLVMDASGNLLSTTAGGGVFDSENGGGGTVFELTR